MAINLDEELLSLADAARALPRLRKDRKVHVSTLYRWISRGVRGVRLEALKIGRTVVTSREALQRFGERLMAEKVGGSESTVAVSDDVDLAEQELRRRGA